jgi:hypothetical protein
MGFGAIRRVGVFELHLAEGEVRRRGVKIKLQEAFPDLDIAARGPRARSSVARRCVRLFGVHRVRSA